VVPADTRGMEAPSSEAGLGLIELLIAMVILQIALLAIIGAFGSGAVALGHAGKASTASVLADQQLELYRSMPYDAIGLDTAGAPTTGTYTGDTPVSPIAAERQVKQVSVVVRDQSTAKELVKEVTTFDCATGNPLGAAPC